MMGGELMQQLTTLESDVLDLIPIGGERKMPLKGISELLGIEERSVYYVVNSLVKKGVPIVATRTGKNRGYYIASNAVELGEGIVSFANQVRDMENRIELLLHSDLKDWQSNIKRAEKS